MPYAPGIEYRGDQYLFQGITQAGQAAAQGIAKIKENRQEQQGLNALAQHYYFKDDPDMLQKFESSGLSAKRAMIGQAHAQEQFSHQQQLQQAHLDTTQRGQDLTYAGEAERTAAHYYFNPKERSVVPEPVPGAPGKMYIPSTGHVFDVNDAGAQPQPVTTPGMEGYYFSPKTGQVIPPAKSQATPAIGADPTGTGNYYWTGKQLAPAVDRRPAQQKIMEGLYQAQMQPIDQEIAEHNAQIGQGDNRYGFLNAFSRPNRVQELSQQKAALQAKMGALTARPGAPAGPAAAAAAPAAAPAATGAVPAAASANPYQAGKIYRGAQGPIRYKGGDPADAGSWEPAG